MRANHRRIFGQLSASSWLDCRSSQSNTGMERWQMGGALMQIVVRCN
ncbi:hypothetical protein CCHR01_15612 [Colletotrichum chrysophilum]|uniref:Uncharacterized protein n=1 Tax=Colletotrichum chrysophilum TaxID=1836956 RepID=A0AAD9EBL6_9PEZI|nr:hypothetical protein CCHR01_15612 [Colletotrichum chrysophilum]